MMKYDIVLGGVGGQGILLASEIIARAAMEKGYRVMMAETHGMAQRGGSVVSHVRLGDIHGALVPEGQGDLVVGFECMEAYRHVHFLKKGGKVLINDHKIKPVTLNEYPSLDFDMSPYEVLKIPATHIAQELGNVIVTNMVIVGAMSQFAGLPVTEKELLRALEETIPPEFLDIDKKAFIRGMEAVR
jgi:indolepyruvate ferredoxin oxidoreductase beta subunit